MCCCVSSRPVFIVRDIVFVLVRGFPSSVIRTAITNSHAAVEKFSRSELSLEDFSRIHFVTIFPLKRVFLIPRRAQRERVRNNVRRLSTNPNGPKNATIPRGGKAKSRVQRSRRATRLGVLREVRQHTELEIEFVRRDVFVALRVEVHGKRTGDFRENARAIARSR